MIRLLLCGFVVWIFGMFFCYMDIMLNIWCEKEWILKYSYKKCGDEFICISDVWIVWKVGFRLFFN